MKYRDLPTSGNPNMTCVNSECEHFLVLYSACRGDYFLAYDYLDVNCGGCGAPMFLARETTRIEILS